MCHKTKTISQVSNGKLTVCKSCNNYQLEFKNFYFEFDGQQYLQFKKYVLEVEIDYWEHTNACPKIKRKIPIPTLQPNLVLIFNRQEIKALQTLFGKQNSHTYLQVDDIDYTLIIN
ncbi:DUF6686 family protein [Lacinutrix jangbogonensis]|uniref:DUF6686 family protein n=1 Tax=Lacinutrix jangbogonensis TaxID=1469557 RepID=UPI00053D1AAB|nr:DUF6686 family protein [Lacinutrix jangbogonensis]